MNYLKMLTLTAVLSTSASCAAINKHTPRESFAFIMSKTLVGVCHDNACDKVDFAAVGSGFVVENKGGGSFVITAGHVCVPYGADVITSEVSIVSYAGNIHKAQLLGVLADQDLCLVFVPDIELPKVKIAKTVFPHFWLQYNFISW